MPYEARRLTLEAAALRESGDLAGAERLCRSALALQEERLGPTHVAVAESLVRIASLRRAQGVIEDAEPLLRRAVDIAERHHDPKAPRSIPSRLTRYLDLLAWVLQESGRWEEAEPLLRRAGGKEGLFLLAKGRHHLGTLEDGGAGQRKMEEAEHLYRHCLRTLPESPTPVPHPSEPHLLRALSETLYDQGRYREAEAVGRRAEQVMAALGPDPPDYPWLWNSEWSLGSL